jgi:hypothetical protein
MSDDEAGGADTPAPVVSIIANPLADAKLAKKVLKVVKKGARSAACGAAAAAPRACVTRAAADAACRGAASKAKAVRRGVKEVVKALRKKPAGCAPGRDGCSKPLRACPHRFAAPRALRASCRIAQRAAPT